MKKNFFQTDSHMKAKNSLFFSWFLTWNKHNFKTKTFTCPNFYSGSDLKKIILLNYFVVSLSLK